MEQRKYALVKWAEGDWLCASNDQQTVWRFNRYYEDGSVEGLKGYYWEASYLSVEAFDQWRERANADPDVNDINNERWRIAQSPCATRKAAIEAMLTRTHVPSRERGGSELTGFDLQGAAWGGNL